MTGLVVFAAIVVVCGACMCMVANDWDGLRRGIVVILAGAVIALIVILLSPYSAFGRDLDGRYAQSDLHQWFEGLTTPGGGRCCDLADGTGVEAIDWFIDGDHYVVKVDGAFVEVPDNKVVKEPNRFGQAVVWTYFQNGVPTVRCFMPGSLG